MKTDSSSIARLRTVLRAALPAAASLFLISCGELFEDPEPVQAEFIAVVSRTSVTFTSGRPGTVTVNLSVSCSGGNQPQNCETLSPSWSAGSIHPAVTAVVDNPHLPSATLTFSYDGSLAREGGLSRTESFDVAVNVKPPPGMTGRSALVQVLILPPPEDPVTEEDAAERPRLTAVVGGGSPIIQGAGTRTVTFFYHGPADNTATLTITRSGGPEFSPQGTLSGPVSSGRSGGATVNYTGDVEDALTLLATTDDGAHASVVISGRP